MKDAIDYLTELIDEKISFKEMDKRMHKEGFTDLEISKAIQVHSLAQEYDELL